MVAVVREAAAMVAVREAVREAAREGEREEVKAAGMEEVTVEATVVG